MQLHPQIQIPNAFPDWVRKFVIEEWPSITKFLNIGWIFCKQSWLTEYVTILARLTTKQNGMKKDKYLIFDKLEKDCFEKW